MIPLRGVCRFSSPMTKAAVSLTRWNLPERASKTRQPIILKSERWVADRPPTFPFLRFVIVRFALTRRARSVPTGADLELSQVNQRRVAAGDGGNTHFVRENDPTYWRGVVGETRRSWTD